MNTIDKLKQCYKYDFINLSFRELILNYYKIELRITTDIEKIVNEQILNSGFIRKNDLYISDKIIFNKNIEYLKQKRTLFIMIHEVKAKDKLLIENIEISSFGLIKNVEIAYPKQLNGICITLKFIIKDLITSAYNSLETAFQINADHVTKEIFDKSYAITVSHLKDKGKESLKKHFWFVMFHKQEGLYIRNKEIVKSAIEKYKGNQNCIISPSELLIWFLTHPLEYNLSLTKESIEADKLITKKMSSVNFVEEKEFFHVSGALQDYNEIGGLPICVARDYILTINICAKYKEEIIPLINEIKELLGIQFRQEIKNYSIFIRTIKKINRMFKEPTFIDSSSQIIGKISGEIIKTLLKG